jgi:nucleotide-binding universal stress UspA family protein
MIATKILCPTDFSTGSQAAVRVAVGMARDSGAELVLLHAWHVPPAAYSLESPFPPNLLQSIVNDSQLALDAAVRAATAAGVTQVSGKLLMGAPWIEIVAELEKQAFDLCVIGTHGRTGLARVLLGSIAEKVVRHAPCPVLVVRPDGDVKPFHHALVPTDFSESAMHALDLAATLVEPTGSITLLHVIEIPVGFSGEITISDFARDLDKHAAAALDKELARMKRTSRLPVRVRSRIGYAGAETLAVLDGDPDIDLVVMGSHGRSGIKRVLMGSVAEKVVRHARCPVLVARRQG